MNGCGTAPGNLVWRYFDRYPSILTDISPITIEPISREADTDAYTDMANTYIPFADILVRP